MLDAKCELMPELIDRICRLSVRLDPRPTGTVSSGGRLDGVRAVLFDVYGTLVVSGSGDVGTATATDSAEAFCAAAAAAGLGSVTVAEGATAVAKLKQAILSEHDRLRAAGVEVPEVDILAIWRGVLSRLSVGGVGDGSSAVDSACVSRLAVEYECRVNPVWPMPGVELTLDELCRSGLRLGIVSNAQFYTPLLFGALLGRMPVQLGFSPDLCAWSYELREAKPSPAGFRRVLDRLASAHGIGPGQTVYVGNDMLNDVATAARVGCRTVLFAGDRRSLRLRADDARCGDVRPDAVITALRELVELIVGAPGDVGVGG